jgi:hypothetical protein
MTKRVRFDELDYAISSHYRKMRARVEDDFIQQPIKITNQEEEIKHIYQPKYSKYIKYNK